MAWLTIADSPATATRSLKTNFKFHHHQAMPILQSCTRICRKQKGKMRTYVRNSPYGVWAIMLGTYVAIISDCGVVVFTYVCGGMLCGRRGVFHLAYLVLHL